MPIENTLTYVRASRLDQAGLGLSTSGGRSEHPYFFRGYVENAEQAARALLAIAEVSRTRYFDPTARLRMKDPVVTSNRTVLRFESFSTCNGVYARLDVDDDGFEAEWLDWGTTNVDLNEPVRQALAAIAPGEPLRLTVGAESVEVETLDDAVVEEKVPLPERWLRGFAETQLASSTMRPIMTLGPAQARAALRDLPKLKSSPRTPWVAFGGTGARMTSLVSEATPCLVGPQRLNAVRHVARYATGLTVYAPEQRTRLSLGGSSGRELALQPSAWVVHMDGARFTLVVSPELYRGFSGEGAVLAALATVDEGHVARVAALLEGQAALEPQVLAEATGLTANEVRGALAVLGAAGRTGFDLHTGAFFHRDLPYDRAALADVQPRLKDAWELVIANTVTAVPGIKLAWSVRSGDATYTVRFEEEGGLCNCPWFIKHRGERGPCKHVLAAGLVRDGAVLPTETGGAPVTLGAIEVVDKN